MNVVFYSHLVIIYQHSLFVILTEGFVMLTEGFVILTEGKDLQVSEPGRQGRLRSFLSVRMTNPSVSMTKHEPSNLILDSLVTLN